MSDMQYLSDCNRKMQHIHSQRSSKFRDEGIGIYIRMCCINTIGIYETVNWRGVEWTVLTGNKSKNQ